MIKYRLALLALLISSPAYATYYPNNPNGQATMANSAPVVIASDQSAVAATCSAGTNLNTSLLALEGGGNLATLAGGVASSLYQVNLVNLAGVALGAMANYGTSPGAVKVPGVNAFITNTPTVTANAGTNLNTSALALDTSVNGVLLAQGSTTSGQSGPMCQGAVTTNAPTYTTAKTDPLSLDTSGLLRISLKDTPANTNKFLVTPDSVALPLHQSVNVDQLNGTTTDTNSGSKSAGTLRVVLATDQPQLTAKLLVTPDSVALPANQSVNAAQIAGTNTVTGGVAGSLGIGGQAANNATTAGYPVPISGLAESAEPTLATNGQNAEIALDLAHKVIVSPYANKENFVSGTNSATNTTSTSLISAPGSGLYIYVTAVSCFNSGSTAVTVDFENGDAGATIYEGFAPAGGGFTQAFPTPIGGSVGMSSNTALMSEAGGSTTTLYCNASGYKGS